MASSQCHPHISHVANPLHQLTKKEVAWKWSENEEAAFRALKRLVTLAPVLVLPDQSTCFRLETDTSSYATGAVLSQLCEDEKWHPVGFTSKSLNPVERNYAIYDKELLSVICGLEEWRHILKGTEHTIEILNNHKNLIFLNHPEPKPSPGMLVPLPVLIQLFPRPQSRPTFS